MKKLLTTFTLLAFAVGLAGCNTMRGMGRDIERGGEKLQNSASGASTGASSGSSSTNKDGQSTQSK